jgi:hypothetical protein
MVTQKKQMIMDKENKLHGLMSLALVDLAVVMGIYCIMADKILYAILYTLFLFIGFSAIIFFFCRKCSSRNNCSHVFLGPITKIMPQAKRANYSPSDYFIVLIILLLIIGIPQFWLWKFSVLPIAHWILLLVAGFQIKTFVCKKCGNTKCAMCKKCTSPSPTL